MPTQTPTLTSFADLFRPDHSAARWVYDAVLVAAGSVLIALSAQVSAPLWFSPVPVTGQTFAVLLVGTLLGGNRGAAAVLAYLLEGCAGMPVFAGGATGAMHLAGPTGGYLIGFVAGAWITGALAEYGWDRQWSTAAVAMSVGLLAIFVSGVVWLAAFVGWANVLVTGLLPFVPGSIVMIALATAMLPAGWKVMRWLRA